MISRSLRAACRQSHSASNGTTVCPRPPKTFMRHSRLNTWESMRPMVKASCAPSLMLVPNVSDLDRIWMVLNAPNPASSSAPAQTRHHVHPPVPPGIDRHSDHDPRG